MRLTAAIAIVSVLPLSAALADVYRSVDAQGHVLYSDSYTPGAELVRSGGSRNLPMSQGSSLTAAPKPAATPATATKTADGPGQKADSQLATADAARSVQSDLAKSRDEQCKDAKDRYEKSIAAHRLYTVAADGSRQFLSTDDIEKNRIQNKLQMDQLCGGDSSQQ